MRARSHCYPDRIDKYIDTTYYDEEREYLDLGYQRLKHLNPKLHPQFSYLKRLFVDHNNLTELPPAKYLPNLEQLTCSWNRLTSIPFYPKLIFINIAGNEITSCKQYDGSGIKYFDCSYNPKFEINFHLPKCKHLYINDTNLRSINLDFFPKLEFLDASNNKLNNISGGSSIIELDIKYNYITELPYLPKLVILMADFNQIEIMPTYPSLISVSIAHNKLVQIKNQPSLRKIIANNNIIKSLGQMPKLNLIDLSHNNINHYHIPPKVEYVSLQFNPTTNITLDPLLLKHIKELQVNFETYKHIYATYYDNFEAVNVQTNEEKLEYLLKKLSSVFDNDNLSRYVFRKFNSIQFRNREVALFKIALFLYWKFFTSTQANNINELVKTKEFRYILKAITKFYYKTIVVTLYFNGYTN